MSKFFIRLGVLNKILSIPFIVALVQLFLIIFELFFQDKRNNVVIDIYSKALGQILIIIIPYIKCFSLSNQKKSQMSMFKKKLFTLFYLIISL